MTKNCTDRVVDEAKKNNYGAINCHRKNKLALIIIRFSSLLLDRQHMEVTIIMYKVYTH